MIYCSEHYSTAMLEKLVHGSGRLPPNQHFVTVTIPNGVSYEVASPAFVPGWDEPGGGVSRAFGAAWQAAGRSLVLLLPSVVARMERNVLINASHGEFGRVSWGLGEPVRWDGRLFGTQREEGSTFRSATP